MFRDENQRHRVIGLLERRGRLEITEGVIFQRTPSQVQMHLFLNWLERAERRERGATLDFGALKAKGDAEMLEMQVNLLAAIVVGHDAIDEWVADWWNRVRG